MGQENRSLTAVPGVAVGHATDRTGGTGCTVVLVEGGAVAAASGHGAALSARQFGALGAGHVVPRVNGVLLAGGSAFGLDAAGGALGWLEERGVGLRTPAGPVPIVPAAAVYDLGCGDARARPGPEMGRAACAVATRGPVAEGSVGVGTGATVGKLRGVAFATKGGVGSWAVGSAPGLVAAALVVVNAFGDVRDPDTGVILAGARGEDGAWLDTRRRIAGGALGGRPVFGQNTTLAVVATNAALPRGAVGRAAGLAAGAFGACLSPAGTMVDGDVVIGLATGTVEAELHQVGLLWEEALRVAIVRAVRQADGLHGIPAWKDRRDGGE